MSDCLQLDITFYKVTEQQNNHFFQGLKLNLLYFDTKHDIFWVWFRVNDLFLWPPWKIKFPNPYPSLLFLVNIETHTYHNQLKSASFQFFFQMNPNLGILYIKTFWRKKNYDI